MELLQNPTNHIYDSCTSFDDICNVIEDFCKGCLSGDSIISLASSKIAYAKDINPDDSCLEDKINKNHSIEKMGITSSDISELNHEYGKEEMTDNDFMLFMLSRSRLLYREYSKNTKTSM